MACASGRGAATVPHLLGSLLELQRVVLVTLRVLVNREAVGHGCRGGEPWQDMLAKQAVCRITSLSLMNPCKLNEPVSWQVLILASKRAPR